MWPPIKIELMQHQKQQPQWGRLIHKSPLETYPGDVTGQHLGVSRAYPKSKVRDRRRRRRRRRRRWGEARRPAPRLDARSVALTPGRRWQRAREPLSSVLWCRPPYDPDISRCDRYAIIANLNQITERWWYLAEVVPFVWWHWPVTGLISVVCFYFLVFLGVLPRLRLLHAWLRCANKFPNWVNE